MHILIYIYKHHRNIPEFEINGTRLLTNQLGYVKYADSQAFLAIPHKV